MYTVYMISKSNWRLRVSKISPRTHTHTPLLLIIQHPKSKPVQTFSRNQQTAFTLVWKHHLAMRWFLLIVITPDQLGLDRDPSPILRAASQPGPAWVPLLQGMKKGKEIDKTMWNFQPNRFGSLVILQSSVSETKHQINSCQSILFFIHVHDHIGCLPRLPFGCRKYPMSYILPHVPFLLRLAPTTLTFNTVISRNHTCIAGCMPGARLRLMGRHYLLHFRQVQI